MISDINAFLSSDTFLSCILVLFLSMLGIRLLPFSLSDVKVMSMHHIWKEIVYGSPSRSQLERAIAAFHRYEQLALLEIKQMQKSYTKVSRAHKRVGYEIGYPAKLDRLSEVTRINVDVTSAIAELALEELGQDMDQLGSATSNDLREVREALRHFVRDWSAEAKEERDLVIQPILEVLEEVDPERRGDVKVLVPGSGLGRLAWEISRLGFTTYANEISPFMNICFRFLVFPDCTRTIFQHTLHPYAHWFSHQRTNANLFRSVSFPDALPRLSSTFHHIRSDFFRLDAERSYDYIVTQFFIDTSFNIISTLEQIHRLLRPGGTWINLGPLLWRDGAQAALELSLEEVLDLVGKIGFVVDERRRKTLECEYTADREAMMRWVYKAEFWIAQKK